MPSETDLANLALSHIGARRIRDYQSEESVEARAARLHFPIVLDSLLARHPWNFGTRRVEVTIEEAPRPNREFPYAFTLPADCVRVLRLTRGDIDAPVSRFSVEGRTLLTHLADYELLYITRDCLAELDPLFIDAFTLTLASRLASDVAADPTLKQSLLQQIEQLHLPAATNADARATNSGENFGPRTILARSHLVGSRFSSRNANIYRPTLP
jgi:hypothetical protein